MHALPIAVRFLKPQHFEKNFRPYFIPIDMTYIDPIMLPKVCDMPPHIINQKYAALKVSQFIAGCTLRFAIC